MKLSFILIAHNVKKHIAQSLAAIQEAAADLTTARVCDCEIIVVDSASGDGSAEAAKAAVPSARLIRNTCDKGFAAAANAGIHAASGDMLCFVDPETAPEPGAVRRLLEYMETNTSCGIAGGRIIDQKGFTLRGARRLPGCVSKAISALGIPCRCTGSTSQPQEVKAVNLAFTCVRRTLLDSLGPLDERFAGGYADYDLCRRARKALNPKWKVAFVPQAAVRVLDRFAMRPEPQAFSLYGESVVRKRIRSEQLYFWKHFCAGTVLVFALADMAAHGVRYVYNAIPRLGSADMRAYHYAVIRQTAHAMLDTQLGTQYPATPWDR